MANKIESQIEKALMSRFPGLRVKFTIKRNGEWEYKMLAGSKDRFDEQYPGMSQEQADAQILIDIKAIISQFMPTTEFIGYERYGKYDRFDAG